MNNQSVNIIHTADLHLGSDFSSLSKIQQRTRQADLYATFSKIIDLCKQEDTDILLIAGDLFESWSVDENIFSDVSRLFSSIQNTNIIISAGNHDPAGHNTPYENPELWSDNVYIMPTTYDSILFDDLSVEIWGASFDSPYVEQSIFMPASPKKLEYIQIGIIHGVVGNDSTVYNPITVQQIKNSNLDYLALGHSHAYSGLQSAGNTTYAYCGCPEGRGFDELDEKGIIIGCVTKQNMHNLKFKPIQQRMYIQRNIDISQKATSPDVANLIIEILSKEYGDDYTNNLYKLILTGEISDTAFINLTNVKGMLSDLFFVKLRDKSSIAIDLNQTAKEPTLRGLFAQGIINAQESGQYEQNIIENALTLGIRAFSDEVEYYED